MKEKVQCFMLTLETVNCSWAAAPLHSDYPKVCEFRYSDCVLHTHHPQLLVTVYTVILETKTNSVHRAESSQKDSRFI
jgi:hypothetical protein